MIAVTGATGKLGGHVIRLLLEKVPASQIIAAVRNPEKAGGLGVPVRKADYERPETLITAFAGVEKLLLISSNEVGRRARQHEAVIAAAREAGVRLLVYTSLLRADRSGLDLAEEHRQTEEAIRRSGIPYVLLRNGWYLENHTEHLDTALASGTLYGAARDGRFSSAARADYAAAAVAVLTTPGHENGTYELAGDTSFTLADLAAELSHKSGKPIVYRDLAPAEYAEILVSAGFPAPVATMFAGWDERTAAGDLYSTSTGLHELIGRPTTTLAQAVHL